MQAHKAIVRRGTNLKVEFRTTPEPKGGEILIAPESVSLCGTDIQILRRERNDPSPIVGHEGASRIVQTGNDADGFKIGDRVIVNPTHPEDPSFLLGHNVEGLFQERVIIAESAVSSGLVSVMKSPLSSPMATLIEPYAVVRYALSCLAVSAPTTLVIVGDGVIGNLAAKLAPQILFPMVNVVVIHRHDEGRVWTENFASHTTNVMSLRDAREHISERTAVISATHRAGTIASIEEAVRVFGPSLVAVHPIGGVEAGSRTPLIPGIDLDGIRQAGTGGPWPPRTSVFVRDRQRVAFSGNRGVTSDQLKSAANELSQEEPAFKNLLTHIVEIEDGAKFMNRMVDGKTRIIDGELVMRLVVDMNKG